MATHYAQAVIGMKHFSLHTSPIKQTLATGSHLARTSVSQTNRTPFAKAIPKIRTAPSLSLFGTPARFTQPPSLAAQARSFSQSSSSFKMATMQALVYAGYNKPQVQERPKPKLQDVGDAIVKMKHATICGTDLHILKGSVATCQEGRILGHEGVGVVEEVGEGVHGFQAGDLVLLACVSKCGICAACRKDMPSHCQTGGWILGNQIDGTQAEYVRIPHASGSMYHLPDSIAPHDALALSDALPTGMEVGTLNAKVRPGKTLAIIGGGPVGLSALLTAKFYTPREILVIDFDDNRLGQAKALGATQVANPKNMNVDQIKEQFSDGEGFDCVIEAVGNQGAFEMAQQLVGIGGDLANLGVHGKPVGLHLESLWDRNLALRSKVVDATSIPTLIQLSEKKIIDPAILISHTFKWSEVEKAYDVFGHAAENKALKVRIDFD